MGKDLTTRAMSETRKRPESNITLTIIPQTHLGIGNIWEAFFGFIGFFGQGVTVKGRWEQPAYLFLPLPSKNAF